jgi:four helix bundle protein
MGQIKKLTDLRAWQEGHILVVNVYRATDSFPKNEQFGLTSQIRRAVISITSNIAEGLSRQTRADKIHFYIMAHGSATEVQNQLLAARDIGYLNKETFIDLANQSVIVHKIITGLIKSLKEKQ